MIRLDGFSPSDMTFNGGFKFRSASQGRILHRVLAINGGKNALYSILKDDKLAMIYDADGDSQAADLLEDIGFEFEQSCADSDQEDPKACANKRTRSGATRTHHVYGRIINAVTVLPRIWIWHHPSSTKTSHGRWSPVLAMFEWVSPPLWLESS